MVGQGKPRGTRVADIKNTFKKVAGLPHLLHVLSGSSPHGSSWGTGRTTLDLAKGGIYSPESYLHTPGTRPCPHRGPGGSENPADASAGRSALRQLPLPAG